MTYVLFSIVIFILLESWWRKTDFFSPFRLYLFFHCLTLGISVSYDYKHMDFFGPITSFVYFGSGVSFLLGNLSAKWIMGIRFQRLSSKSFEQGDYSWRVHGLLTIGLFWVFMSALFIVARKHGTFPIFDSKSATTARDFYESGGVISNFVQYSSVVLSLLFMAILNVKRRIVKYGFVFVFLLTFILYTFTTSRSQLLIFLSFAFLFYHYTVRPISMTKLMAIGGIILALMAGSFYLKFKQHSKIVDKVGKDIIIETVLLIPYTYIANNYWNLQYVFDGKNTDFVHRRTHGFVLIAPLLQHIYVPSSLAYSLRSSEWYDDDFHDSIQKIQGMNTIGYQWNLYKDFGMWGVFLLPYLAGLLISYLYISMRKYGGKVAVVTYAFAAVSIILSYAGGLWNSDSYLQNFTLLLIVVYMSSVKIKKMEKKNEHA